MRSRRQTLAQGPVPRKPRSYLSRRKHSVAPPSRGSRRPSLVSEDGLSLCPCARQLGADGSLRSPAPPRRTERNPSRQDVRQQQLALLRFSSLFGRSSPERISADDVTSRLLSQTPPIRKEVRMNTS